MNMCKYENSLEDRVDERVRESGDQSSQCGAFHVYLYQQASRNVKTEGENAKTSLKN
jgi:hypothetical protein